MKTWRKEKLDLENQVLKLNKQIKEKKGDDDEKDEIIAGIEFQINLLQKKKIVYLPPGHDRVQTIKSQNISIAKIWY